MGIATVELNYQRSGSGAPLVLIHGIGGELCVWEPVLERLEAERNVIAIDLPGFGRSEALAEQITPTPQRLAMTVATFSTISVSATAHIAGNSLGGWVALELALTSRARSVTRRERNSSGSPTR